MRSSSCSPTIVCVFISSHSSSSSGPALLMISAGIFTLPTSWSSAANSARWRCARLEPELVGDADDEVDDVAAVAAGVLVVGLDDVAEQHRRAAVRGRELERVVDAVLPLAREGREEQEHGQHEQERPRTAYAANATSSPSGASSASTAKAGSTDRRCARGESPTTGARSGT